MKYALTLTSTLLFLTSPVLALTVNVDYDKDADFSNIKTFAWVEGTYAPNPLVHQRIVNAIKYHLSMSGLTETDENPDVLVTYHGSTKEELSIDTTHFDYYYAGGRAGWYRGGSYGSLGSSTTVTTYTVGTLVVDIWIAESKKLIWRAEASATVTSNAAKNEKKINKAAQKMFAKFPPQ